MHGVGEMHREKINFGHIHFGAWHFYADAELAKSRYWVEDTEVLLPSLDRFIVNLTLVLQHITAFNVVPFTHCEG